MRKTTVLVIDDTATVRATMGALLRRRGYQAILASDAEEGLRLATECAPDVILLDIVMPGTDGIAMLQQLKLDADLARIPVVFLSQKTSLDDIVRGLSLGGHDYLTKPAQPEEVVARVAAAARVKHAADEVRARNEDLEAFSLRASHDLKSPLTVIRQAAALLGNPKLKEEMRAQMLDMIDKNVGRADRLINDLLALARTSRPDGITVVPDPDERVKDIVATLGAPDASIEIKGEWAAVSMSASDFTSVMTNLIDNASHYGRSEDGTLTLTIDARNADDDLEIELTDAGRGVNPEDQAHLFEPFYRAADSTERNPLSSGVGLALVKRQVERNGGSIILTSEPGHGARFTLRVPLAQPPASNGRHAG